MAHECCEQAVSSIDLYTRDGASYALLDLGHAYTKIAYCPWCGVRLPSPPERSYEATTAAPTLPDIREWRNGFSPGSFARQALDRLLEATDDDLIDELHLATDRLNALAEAHRPGAARCGDPECSACAILDCPSVDPLHYHHDGCPACAFADPRHPEADVDTKAQAMGIDAKALAKQGSDFARTAIGREAALDALAMLCEREAFNMIAKACSCETETSFICGYHRQPYESELPARLTRFLMFRAYCDAPRRA